MEHPIIYYVRDFFSQYLDWLLDTFSPYIPGLSSINVAGIANNIPPVIYLLFLFRARSRFRSILSLILFGIGGIALWHLALGSGLISLDKMAGMIRSYLSSLM